MIVGTSRTLALAFADSHVTIVNFDSVIALCLAMTVLFLIVCTSGTLALAFADSAVTVVDFDCVIASCLAMTVIFLIVGTSGTLVLAFADSRATELQQILAEDEEAFVQCFITQQLVHYLN